MSKKDQLLNEILAILATIKEDQDKLEQVHRFMVEEIYEEEETRTIPEKYRKLVHDVAESLDCGLICFINPDTLEMEDVPSSLMEDEFMFEEWEKEEDMMEFKHKNWDKVIEISPLESFESFKIMEAFAAHVPDEKFSNKLYGALNGKRPFANFKYLIDTSKYRQAWFDFKQGWLEEYVFDILAAEMGLDEV